jgi:hypothetical protein
MHEQGLQIAESVILNSNRNQNEGFMPNNFMDDDFEMNESDDEPNKTP